MINLDRHRLRALQAELAAAIPCEPEDVRADLQAMDLIELLGRYLNWADRLIPPRPRRVLTWDGFLRHGHAVRHEAAVRRLAARIEAGEDLKPFLSDKVDRCGYVRPAASKAAKPRGVEWGDKDYALNAYEVHHLHLGDRVGADGWASRTRELLYAAFSREEAFLILIGDHNSFDDGTLARALSEARVGSAYELRGTLGLTRQHTDRERNALQRRGITTAVEVGSHVVLGGFLSTAGTSPAHTRHADHLAEVLAELDPKLDEPGFGRDWFERNGRPSPAAPEYRWVMQHCDLALLEASQAVLFPMVKWKR